MSGFIKREQGFSTAEAAIMLALVGSGLMLIHVLTTGQSFNDAVAGFVDGLVSLWKFYT